MGSPSLEKAQWVLGTQVTYSTHSSKDNTQCALFCKMLLRYLRHLVLFVEPNQQTCSLRGTEFKYNFKFKGGEDRQKALDVFEFLPSCFSVQVTLITSW